MKTGAYAQHLRKTDTHEFSHLPHSPRGRPPLPSQSRSQHSGLKSAFLVLISYFTLYIRQSFQQVLYISQQTGNLHTTCMLGKARASLIKLLEKSQRWHNEASSLSELHSTEARLCAHAWSAMQMRQNDWKHPIIPEASKCRKPLQEHMVSGWLPSQEVQASSHKSSKSKESESWRTQTF